MSNARVINEFNYGVIVWYTEDGRLVTNSDGDVLNAPVNDITDKKEVDWRVGALRKYAEELGIKNGRPNFWSGNRRVSQEEYENQIARQEAGLIPDMFDQGAINDEIEEAKKKR